MPILATKLYIPRLRPNVFTGLIGEGLTILWLLVKSVNVQKWREQESRAWEPESRVKGEAAV